MSTSSGSKIPDVPPVVFDDERLEELERTGLLEEESIENFDRLTRQAADAVGASAAFVSLLTEDGQFLRGCVGLPEPLASTRKTPLRQSICAYTLDRDEPLVIDDATEHPELKDHSAVSELGIEAYLGVPLRTSEGNVVGTFCVVEWEPRTWTAQDVETVKDFAASAQTEVELRLQLHHQQDLEAKLRARSEAFEALVGNITDVVTVLDEEGIIQFESPSVTEVLGYEPHELEGNPIWTYIHPEDRSELRGKMEATLENPDRRPTAEFRFRHADGSWRTLESKGRLLPEEVDLGVFIGVSRDVTEQRELEEQVQLLATAVDNAETGVLITGPNLSRPGPKIQYVNEAVSKMTGYEEEELLGNTPRMLQGPETGREALDRLKRRLSDGKPVIDEVVNYRKDGTPYYVRWRISPIKDESGETTHFVSVQEDITAEKEREEELERRVKERTKELRAARDEAERASRLKSALLANMSHEIRTPLTSIIGFAESIEEEVQEGSQDVGLVSRFAALIAKSGRRLLDTLKAVLNLSKLESGDIDFAEETIDAAAELREAAELFDLRAEEAGLDLVLDVPDAPLLGRADSDALQIVLKNLISNAVKFTEEGGTITLRGRRNGDAVVVEVEDTGIGMDPEQVPELFTAFKQASQGIGREYEGTGLGLAVTAEAVEQMDGSIDVETEEGQGSRFIVRLPKAEEGA